ncbi:MAG TPA: PEP-CTERM sorting domain-containing protein [Bryobacteraceae bacterium]|nr:PEP-CTERM sorting domain-containing protein [Bryobacteraceae bacterium]
MTFTRALLRGSLAALVFTVAASAAIPINPTPEPASIGLMAVGAAGVLLVAKKFRRK